MGIFKFISKNRNVPSRKSKKPIPANIDLMIKQAKETASIINTTKNPEVFFGRLGFLFDLLLELKKYELSYNFSHTPSQDLKNLEKGLEKVVSIFIERYVADTKLKVSKLKTENGKQNKYKDSMSKLLSAFDCANTFWKGNGIYPHYTGPLYTKKNYIMIKAIYDNM